MTINVNAKKGVAFKFKEKTYYLKFNMCTYADLEEEFGMPLNEFLEQADKKLTLISASTILYTLLRTNYEDFEYTNRQFLMGLDITEMETCIKTVQACFELFNNGPKNKSKKGGSKKDGPLSKAAK